MKYILAIDMGTTAFKAAVFAENGSLCGSSMKEYKILSEKPGWAEMEVSTYLDTFSFVILGAIKDSGIDPADIASVGMSAQGETTLFLGENDTILRNAIVWFDNRSKDQARKIVAEFGSDSIQVHTGQVGEDAIWPGAKLMWLRENEPEIFSRIRKIIHLKGYFAYLLTGVYACEDSILGSSMYWDINTRKYWPEMLEFIGISHEQLPVIFEPGSIIGRVTEEAADRFGLSAGTAVNIGGIDLACGAIGSGNIKPGAFSESIGSALCTMTMVDHIVIDPAKQMPCYCSAIPGMYMVHAYATGGMFMKWFRDSFCEMETARESEGGLNAYDQLDRLSESIAPGADGLIALPHLQGSGPPDLSVTSGAAFFNITLAHGKGHFVRAIMESVAMVLCRIIEATEALDVQVNDIISIGGGTMSRVWCQIKADAAGRRLITTKRNENACCLGAAILAGVAAGMWPSVEEACNMTIETENLFEPDPENQEIYKELLVRYKKLMGDISEI